MNILGISAFYHDSAACLVQDGKIIAAAQEERFSRKKNDFSFPKQAIKYCLKQANLQVDDLNFIAFYDKFPRKFKRILSTYLGSVPSGIRFFINVMPLWIKQKFCIEKIIKTELNFDGKIIFSDHQHSHAASAFFPSPYQEAAFLVIDGVGGLTTTSYGLGKNNNIQIINQVNFPHSLGFLYSAFTQYIGFKVNSDEYKLMGLAPYGEPKYKDLILSHLIDLKEEGSFKLNMKYFAYPGSSKIISSEFEKLFGTPARKPYSAITQRDMDLARSVQLVVEETVLGICKYVYKQTGQKNLCLSGNVALNCVANGRILRGGPFENIWIQPAADEAGGALGCALFVWYQYLANRRMADGQRDSQEGSLLGPEFSKGYIHNYLDKNKIAYQELSTEEIPEKIADLIAAQKVIGWFQGRMEFGPRALGARSIIADARHIEMQEIMNSKIKFRESFRPFAPSVIKEKMKDFFEMESGSPYMLLTVPVKEKIRNKLSAEDEKRVGLEKLHIRRSAIAAVTHVDYSARVQTVTEQHNPLFYHLIQKFDQKYNCPVIINTSFNTRGEPIVCSPQDAYSCFVRTDMEYLLMGNFLIKKDK